MTVICTNKEKIVIRYGLTNYKGNAETNQITETASTLIIYFETYDDNLIPNNELLDISTLTTEKIV